jgi:hypothetical protein
LEEGGGAMREGEAFLEKLLNVLDELGIGYDVTRYGETTEVRIPLDGKHIPDHFTTTDVFGESEIVWEEDYDDNIDDYLDLVATEIAKRLGFSSPLNLPYFEPLDLTWYFIIPNISPAERLEK